MYHFPYKGDWRVKEYKAYTEKLEDYVALLDELVDLLREELASKKEYPAPTKKHYYRLKPYIRPAGTSWADWGHRSTNLWP